MSVSPSSTPMACLLRPEGHRRRPARPVVVVEEVDEHRGGVDEPEEADEKAERMRARGVSGGRADLGNSMHWFRISR
jgi:hypothetical protein